MSDMKWNDEQGSEGHLRYRRTLTGDIEVVYEGPAFEADLHRLSAALLATKRLLTGTAPEPDSEDHRNELLVVGTHYQRLLTEIACWNLVRAGELMLSLSPSWVAGDEHRQVQFMTLDRKRIVFGVTH